MDNFWQSLVSFLAILNPFALCLYLTGLMEHLRKGEFARILAGACVVTFFVFALFGLTGERILVKWLGIRTEALRAFGGVIFFIVAYKYVISGYKAAEMLRGSLQQLPSAIAMPFMIGAGTITQSILIGKQNSNGVTIVIILLGIVISFIIVMLFKSVHDLIHTRRERIFERYVNLLARANGLLIGAISTEMIVSGLRALWYSN